MRSVRTLALTLLLAPPAWGRGPAPPPPNASTGGAYHDPPDAAPAADPEDDDEPFDRRRAARGPAPELPRFGSPSGFLRGARLGGLGPLRRLGPGEVAFLWDPEAALRRRLEDLEADPDSGAPREGCRVSEVDVVSFEWMRGAAQRRVAAALAGHAARGARVRLLLPDSGLLTDAEARRLVEGLVSAGVEAAWFPAPDAGNLVDRLNKQIHVKMLRVEKDCVGAARPVVIIGGRNVHDTYYRDARGAVLGQAVPEDETRDPGVRYQDLDIRLEGEGPASDARRLADCLFARARGGPPSESSCFEGLGGLPLLPGRPEAGCEARTFLSSPYEGDRTWEDLFAGMLAETSEAAVCITPYYNPSARAFAALAGAARRGVKVTLFASAEFSRETVPATMGWAARDALSRSRAAGVDVRAWSDPMALHAKTCLFDDVLYVGNANLNMRSFKHDAEAGVLLRCAPAVAAWREAALADAAARSRPWQGEGPGALERLLLKVLRYYH